MSTAERLHGPSLVWLRMRAIARRHAARAGKIDRKRICLALQIGTAGAREIQDKLF